MTWNEKTEERAAAVLAGPAPAFASLERELLAAALPELRQQRLRADAAVRELAAAQRAARNLADAYRHDNKPHPTALSYGVSCPEAGPPVVSDDAVRWAAMKLAAAALRTCYNEHRNARAGDALATVVEAMAEPAQ